MTPPDAFKAWPLGTAATARLMLALCRHDRFRVRQIAAEAGTALQATSRALHRLRDLGVVEFEDGKAGTHRSLIYAVPSNTCANVGENGGSRALLAHRPPSQTPTRRHPG